MPRILIGALVWLVAAAGVSHAASKDNERQIAYQTRHHPIGARSAYATLPLANRHDTPAPLVNFKDLHLSGRSEVRLLGLPITRSESPMPLHDVEGACDAKP